MRTLEKLRQYLTNTSKEEFDKHWTGVHGVGVTGPTFKEYEIFLDILPKPVAHPTSKNTIDDTFSISDSESYAIAA